MFVRYIKGTGGLLYSLGVTQAEEMLSHVVKNLPKVDSSSHLWSKAAMGRWKWSQLSSSRSLAMEVDTHV